jgi:hypothetical protein
MLAMVDLGPAVCEFSIRAKKWVRAHNHDGIRGANVELGDVESLLEDFIAEEHELAFQMLREDIIKPDVSTLYVRGDAMMPVPLSKLRHELIPLDANAGVSSTLVGCIAQGAIDTWYYFLRLLKRLTRAPATCCDAKGKFSENTVSREKMFCTLCREVLHNYARHLREMMAEVVLNTDGDEEDTLTAWSRHRNVHTQLGQGVRTRDVLGKILKKHVPVLNQRVWCHTTPSKGEEEVLTDLCLGEVNANATEVTNSMPAFYLEARALESDLLEATQKVPMPPEGFRLLHVTGGLDILALITSTAQWLHNMVRALRLFLIWGGGEGYLSLLPEDYPHSDSFSFSVPPCYNPRSPAPAHTHTRALAYTHTHKHTRTCTQPHRPS